MGIEDYYVGQAIKVQVGGVFAGGDFLVGDVIDTYKQAPGYLGRPAIRVRDRADGIPLWVYEHEIAGPAYSEDDIAEGDVIEFWLGRSNATEDEVAPTAATVTSHITFIGNPALNVTYVDKNGNNGTGIVKLSEVVKVTKAEDVVPERNATDNIPVGAILTIGFGKFSPTFETTRLPQNADHPAGTITVAPVDKFTEPFNYVFPDEIADVTVPEPEPVLAKDSYLQFEFTDTPGEDADRDELNFTAGLLILGVRYDKTAYFWYKNKKGEEKYRTVELVDIKSDGNGGFWIEGYETSLGMRDYKRFLSSRIELDTVDIA